MAPLPCKGSKPQQLARYHTTRHAQDLFRSFVHSPGLSHISWRVLVSIREFLCTSTGCFSLAKNTQKLIISNLNILNSLLGWIPVVVPTESKQQRGS